jgi:hypothetical protein
MLHIGQSNGSDAVSRRTALQRFGRAGLLATVGAGMREFVGASEASAKSGFGVTWTANDGSGVPVVLGSGDAGPATCQCTGTLAEGHCDGACPPGFYCYEVDGCGGLGVKYACLECDGTPKCSYDCS